MKKSVRGLALALTVVMLLAAMTVPAWAAGGQEDADSLDELEFSFEETVLVDNDDIYMALQEFDPDGRYGPSFSVELENRTDRPLQFSMTWCAIDEVVCPGYWSEKVAAGKKAYSEISWYAEDLAANGINYIETVEAGLWVYDADDLSADDIYDGKVSWSVPNSGTEIPSAELIESENGYDPIVLLRGLDMAFLDFDADSDLGPTITFLFANRSDMDLTVSAEDVSVNGVMCDPLWAETIPAGKVAYGRCYWWEDDLADARIDAMETVEMPIEVYDEATYDTLAEFTIELDLAAPGELIGREGDAEIPVEAEEHDGYVGDQMRTAFFDFTVNGALFYDEYFGYVPSEGNTLVAVDVTVYNYTDTSVPMFDTDFQVGWGPGEDEFAVPVTTARDGYPNTGVDPVGEMLPETYSEGIHQSREGILLFEVPQDIPDFALGYQEAYDDDTTGDTYFVYFSPEQQ